jgi:hypothetical protein
MSSCTALTSGSGFLLTERGVMSGKGDLTGDSIFASEAAGERDGPRLNAEAEIVRVPGVMGVMGGEEAGGRYGDIGELIPVEAVLGYSGGVP